jgi:hypothetical protein
VNACVHTYTEPQTSSTRSRGLGRRIHGSVEYTKLSTNKQHSLSQPYARDSGNKIAASAHGMGSGGLVVDAMSAAIGCLGVDRRGVCVYYCRTYYKAVRGGGEEESGGHVL